MLTEEGPLMPPACAAAAPFFAPGFLLPVTITLDVGMGIEVVERSRGVWPQPPLPRSNHAIPDCSVVAPALGPAPFWGAGGFHKPVTQDALYHFPRTAYRSLHPRTCSLAAAVFLCGLDRLHVSEVLFSVFVQRPICSMSLRHLFFGFAQRIEPALSQPFRGVLRQRVDACILYGYSLCFCFLAPFSVFSIYILPSSGGAAP